MFSAISGLSGAWMGMGVLGVCAVVAAHLHARSAGRAVWLPTARFLVPSDTERKWPRRVREFLLLLARCAVVLLLVLMFDRPSLPSGAVPGWLSPSLPEARAGESGGASTALVIVLDVSDSMGLAERGRTRLERGVDAARALLDRAESSGRAASVVLAGHSARPLSIRATDRYDRLRGAIDGVGPTRQHADLDSAISAAEQLAASADGGGAEIVVITDGQASAWKDPPSRLSPGSALKIVNAARLPLPRGAYPVGLATDRQRVDAGEAVRAAGVVRNSAPTSVEASALWRVRRGDEIVHEVRQRLSIPAGGQGEAGLDVLLPAPGVYGIELGIEGSDRSAAYALVVVQPEPRIGVISRDGAARSTAMAAADPFGTGRAVAIDPLDDDAADRIAGLDAVVIAGAGLLPDSVLDAIARAMLSTGGGLLHFVDSEGAVATAQGLGEWLPSLYPVEPEGRYVTRGAADPGFSSSVPIDDPPRPLPEGSLTTGWFNMEVRRHAPAEVAPGGQVVIALEDGSVLLAASTRTSPVVLSVLTGIDRDSSDLSIAPELPILVDALIRSARAASGGSDPRVRNAVGDVGDRVLSIGLRGVGPVAGPTEQPGVFILRDEGRGEFVSAFGVNPLEYDAGEADLERIVADRSGRAEGGAVLDSDAVVSGRMARVEIWPLLLAAAVAMLVVEAVLLLPGRRGRGVAL